MLDNTSPALARTWHAVASATEIGDDPVQVWLLDGPWAVVRIDGDLRAFRDRCPHRFAPLSAGRVVGREIECGYHGWRSQLTVGPPRSHRAPRRRHGGRR